MKSMKTTAVSIFFSGQLCRPDYCLSTKADLYNNQSNLQI